MKVVVPIVAGIGNALLASPMVRRLKRKRPDTLITILALTEAMAEVYRRLEEVYRVLVFKRGWRGRLQTLRELRRERFDVFLAPFPSNRWQYSLLAMWSGAHRRILHSYPTGRLRSLAFLPAERIAAQPGLHDVEQNLSLLRALDIACDPPEAPVFPLEDADREHALRMIRTAGLSEHDRPIIVHAGSARTAIAAAKRWPTDRFGLVIKTLVRRSPGSVIMIEGPDEAGIAVRVAEAARPAQPAIIRLEGPLGDAAALLERAALYVGSDSGLAHLAAAVGTPTVTLFAPTDPTRVCPFGHHDGVLRPGNKPCSPCYAYPWRATRPRAACRPPYCIESITVDAVLSRIQEVLSSAPRRANATLTPSTP